MKNIISKIISTITILMLVSGCARDLSSDVYTSDSTLSLTLEGQIISARNITIKENDKLSQNQTGAIAGGVTGGLVGSTTGSNLGIAVGALAGGVIGSFAESKLGTAKGIEYIIKVDISKLKKGMVNLSQSMRNAMSSATTSGLITVIQGEKDPIQEGELVYVIFSEKRVRVIKNKY